MENQETNKSVKKGGIIFLLIMIVTVFFMYGYLTPNIMKKNIPAMESYLKDNGYDSINYVSMNSFTNTVVFNAVKGSKKTVSVRYSNNGLFQIVY